MIPEARELHHVSVVVRSIGESLRFYRDTLQLRAGPVRNVADQQVRVVFLTAPNTRIELIEPTDPTSGVARFLAERGKPTLHHLCFVVDDLRATLAALAERGVELIDREPRHGAEGDVAFVHPRASGGVLIELIDRASLDRPHTS
ncbi:MAG TPA: methylmalonyl-CoA epimerase [Chloroflexi bacterium]|jgi:methylmalonyl-CoA/ethylmalonyl-CoA epimerase|nr:methylmalonyl-CoA epimerase [Chloroflexota bacterium]HAL26575.1 methylmalonyl-CoA epimerase [Chloroflexota bacterium]